MLRPGPIPMVEWLRGAGATKRADLLEKEAMGGRSIDDVRALVAPRAQKLAGAIVGRALYDGRLDVAAALAIMRKARATA